MYEVRFTSALTRTHKHRMVLSSTNNSGRYRRDRYTSNLQIRPDTQIARAFFFFFFARGKPMNKNKRHEGEARRKKVRTGGSNTPEERQNSEKVRQPGIAYTKEKEEMLYSKKKKLEKDTNLLKLESTHSKKETVTRVVKKKRPYTDPPQCNAEESTASD